MTDIPNHSSLDEYLFDEVLDNDLHDCFLSKEEMQELFAPPTETWKDIPPTEYKTKITIDEAKATQWELAKEEMTFVLGNIRTLIKEQVNATQGINFFSDEGEPTTDDIINYILGPDSPIGKILQENLGLMPETYLKFLSTFCIQAAYKVSTSQLFDSESLLYHAVPIDAAEYNEIWRKLATKKRMEQSQFIGAGRRDKCVWEYLEEAVNNLCRVVSISNRTGDISIALDDDKVWVNLTGQNKADTFGIKYTTHVQPNRKGIIAHTAVSTGANMPLGIIIERKKDSTLECFRRLLRFLFETNGNIDLRNVLVASDRGYMLPKAVFDFLVANGCNVVGTVKRSLECWPFTFDQKQKENDARKKIDTKGPPTLFVKSASNSLKKVYAIAFRNGTDRVSTAISSIHRNHHWEGIALSQRERIMYEEDNTSLRQFCIQRIESSAFHKDALIAETELIDTILSEKVNPLTIRQGK